MVASERSRKFNQPTREGVKTRVVSSSIQTYARIGGALFLVSLVAGGFGEGLAPAQLVAPGDAAATAQHIVSSNLLFRLGFAGYLVEGLCDVALTVILFVLLRPVDTMIALFILLFRVMATATFAFAELFYLAPALILNNDAYLKSLSSDQLNTLALLSLNLYGLGGVISLVFYGAGSVGVGYLMFHSGYLPRLLGLLWAIGGAGFVIRTFAVVLAPTAPTEILQLPMILAIAVLAIWLLAKGVNAAKWESQSNTASMTSSARSS